jgi:hypothetical protein
MISILDCGAHNCSEKHAHPANELQSGARVSTAGPMIAILDYGALDRSGKPHPANKLQSGARLSTAGPMIAILDFSAHNRGGKPHPANKLQGGARVSTAGLR